MGHIPRWRFVSFYECTKRKMRLEDCGCFWGAVDDFSGEAEVLGGCNFHEKNFTWLARFGVS